MCFFKENKTPDSEHSPAFFLYTSPCPIRAQTRTSDKLAFGSVMKTSNSFRKILRTVVLLDEIFLNLLGQLAYFDDIASKKNPHRNIDACSPACIHFRNVDDRRVRFSVDSFFLMNIRIIKNCISRSC